MALYRGHGDGSFGALVLIVGLEESTWGMGQVMGPSKEVMPVFDSCLQLH